MSPELSELEKILIHIKPSKPERMKEIDMDLEKSRIRVNKITQEQMEEMQKAIKKSVFDPPFFK